MVTQNVERDRFGQSDPEKIDLLRTGQISEQFSSTRALVRLFVRIRHVRRSVIRYLLNVILISCYPVNVKYIFSFSRMWWWLKRSGQRCFPIPEGKNKNLETFYWLISFLNVGHLVMLRSLLDI